MLAPFSMEPPVGKAIILCDQVITDKLSGNKTIVGTFNRIQANQFPAEFPRMAVYIALTNGSGEVPFLLMLKMEEDGTRLVGAEGTIRFSNPNEIVELTFNFLGVPLPEPGNYVIELSMDGAYLFDTRFSVQQTPTRP